PSGPPSENGGTSLRPGVRSFAAPPSTLTTSKCERRLLCQLVQCRYSKVVYERALSLLFFSASSRSRLQLSSGQSGKTSLVKTSFLPLGEKVTPPASVDML